VRENEQVAENKNQVAEAEAEVIMDPQEGASQFEEEMFALESIYQEDCKADVSSRCFRTWMPSKGDFIAELALHFPTTYPRDPPAIELKSAHLDEDSRQAMMHEMNSLFTPGQVRVCWCSQVHDFVNKQCLAATSTCYVALCADAGTSLKTPDASRK
jgi:RWD domain